MITNPIQWEVPSGTPLPTILYRSCRSSRTAVTLARFPDACYCACIVPGVFSHTFETESNRIPELMHTIRDAS